MAGGARALVLVAVLLVLAPGCTADDGKQPARRSGAVTVGIAAPASLLPADLRDASGRLVAGALWTTLTTVDPSTGEPVLAAAASVTSTDRRTWTVRLRPGGRFHDGSPVTATSFAGAWQAALHERWRGARLLTDVLRVTGAAAAVGRPGAGVAGLTVPDPLTLRIALDRPYAELVLALSAPALAPLPAAVLESRDWAGFQARPVGNGPLRAEPRTRPDAPLRLVRDPAYPGPGRAGAEMLELRTYRSAEDQYRDVEAGRLDLATEIPPGRHDRLAERFGDRHLSVPVPQMTFLAFPVGSPRFASPAVRYALSHAVDRTSLAALALDHGGTGALALQPAAVPLGRRPMTCRACRHDVDAAKALLGQGGGLAGPLRLGHAAEPLQQNGARGLLAQWRTLLGLRDLTPYVRDPARPAAPDGPFLLDVELAYAGPGALLAWADRSPEFRATGYRQSELAQLVAEAEAAATPDAAVRGYQLAENVLLRDLPVAPLWYPHEHYAWSDQVEGVTPAVYAGVALAELRPARRG